MKLSRKGNSKTGCPTSARERATCPTSCVLHDAGCYGLNNGPGGSPTPFEHAARGTLSDAEGLALLAQWTPTGGIVRHHEVGDILGADGKLDAAYMSSMRAYRKSRPDIRNILYTHAWRRVNRRRIPLPVVNASCETVTDVSRAIARGYEPTIVVTEDTRDETARAIRDATGRRAVRCPAEERRGEITCATCGLCAKGAYVRSDGTRTERAVVMFTVHGARRKRAAAAVGIAVTRDGRAV